MSKKIVILLIAVCFPVISTALVLAEDPEPLPETNNVYQVQEQLKQARSERKELQQQLLALSNSKPTLPPGRSASGNTQYQVQLSSWQADMNALKEKIAVKDSQIKVLETKLQKLQSGSAPRRR